MPTQIYSHPITLFNLFFLHPSHFFPFPFPLSPFTSLLPRSIPNLHRVPLRLSNKAGEEIFIMDVPRTIYITVPEILLAADPLLIALPSVLNLRTLFLPIIQTSKKKNQIKTNPKNINNNKVMKEIK